MSVTYSPTLKLAIIANGTEAGTWGDLTNKNLGTLLEQAITGLVTVDLSSGDVPLLSIDGELCDARNSIIVASGSQTAFNSITIPNSTKVYFINNTCSVAIGVKTTTGSSITYSCPSGTLSTVYCAGGGIVRGASTGTSTYQTIANPLITGIRETTTVSATAATGTINFDYLTQANLYYTTAATANWILNFRGNSTTTFNSILGVGQSASVTFIAAQPTASAAFTATIATTTMTVSAVSAGTLYVGQIITGTGVTAGTTISSFGSGSGGTGTYNLSTSSTVSTATAMTGSVPFSANITIDGTSYTPLWQGGAAPTTGNANSLDAYTYAIIKTSATPTYTVLASQTQFKA